MTDAAPPEEAAVEQQAAAAAAAGEPQAAAADGPAVPTAHHAPTSSSSSTSGVGVEDSTGTASSATASTPPETPLPECYTIAFGMNPQKDRSRDQLRQSLCRLFGHSSTQHYNEKHPAIVQ